MAKAASTVGHFNLVTFGDCLAHNIVKEYSSLAVCVFSGWGRFLYDRLPRTSLYVVSSSSHQISVSQNSAYLAGHCQQGQPVNKHLCHCLKAAPSFTEYFIQGLLYTLSTYGTATDWLLHNNIILHCDTSAIRGSEIGAER